MLLFDVAVLMWDEIYDKTWVKQVNWVIVVLVVQSPSYVQLFVTPSTATRKASLSSPISRSLLKFMFIESLMLSNHIILCCPLLLLPPIFPSIRVFSSELALCIRQPKYQTFGFSISPFNEYSEISLISLLFDLLALPIPFGEHWSGVLQMSLCCVYRMFFQI